MTDALHIEVGSTSPRTKYKCVVQNNKMVACLLLRR